MRVIEIMVVFLSLFVMLGGLALPLYWSYVEPIIFNLPLYINSISSDIMNLVNLVLNSLHG